MSHTPSPPDKTFIGRRSRLAGVIYFILGALNFLHCLLYFPVSYTHLTLPTTPYV